MRLLRVLLSLGVSALMLSIPAVTAEGDISDEEVLAILSTAQPRDQAVELALVWLRDQQQDDGSVAGREHRTALTSLAVMAHLAAGITLNDPDHGAWLRRSVAYVLAQQEANGYFGSRDKSRMYGHGITTLMLAEALGTGPDARLREAVRSALERAVAVTVNAARVNKSERDRGGWRYTPGDKNSDLSLSGWQLMSLHACQQVGITVPEEIIIAACDYAQRLTDEDGKVGYQSRGQDKPSLRGLGMLSFVVAGRGSHQLVDRISQRISDDPIQWRGPWLFYRAYYDSVGMARARPEAWARYRTQVETVLVDNQEEDGSWGGPPADNEGRFGRVYTTSMAVLALAVERHVLPAYQR